MGGVDINIKLETAARRWRGHDGLVHLTYPVQTRLHTSFRSSLSSMKPIQELPAEYERWTVCGLVVSGEGSLLRGVSPAAVDIEDDLAMVNCFGCIGGP